MLSTSSAMYRYLDVEQFCQLMSRYTVRLNYKDKSTPATISKQHSQMLQVERFFRQSCFDIVAVFGNSVERNFVLSTKSKQTERVQYVSTLSKDEISFDIVPKPATLLPKTAEVPKESFEL